MNDESKMDQMKSIFYSNGFKVYRLLSTITKVEELDEIVGWLKENHPTDAPENDTITWLKEDITKWCDNLKGHFPEGFTEKFPQISKRFEEDEGNMLLFLRAAEFCGADVWFFAQQIELILKAHEIDGEDYIEIDTPGAEYFHRWVDKPHNARCFVLAAISRYTQMQAMYFRQTFFPGLMSSGGGGGKVHFDWRKEK